MTYAARAVGEPTNLHTDGHQVRRSHAKTMRDEPVLIVGGTRSIVSELRSLLWNDGFSQIEEAADFCSAHSMFVWHDFGLMVVIDRGGSARSFLSEIESRWGAPPSVIIGVDDLRRLSPTPVSDASNCRMLLASALATLSVGPKED